jgi:TorA maturation chaperone TorD
MMAGADGDRDGVYGMLAELFIRPPDRETVSSLLDIDVDIDALASEFTDLLRGLRRSSPPPPYESLYREGVLHGECTSDVLEAYRTFDVHPARSLEGEPPDHISLELDFMRHLCTMESDARDDKELRAILETEQRFLKDHLGTWVGDLWREIERADPSGFYSEVAAFTSRWVDEDRRRVEERMRAMGGQP